MNFYKKTSFFVIFATLLFPAILSAAEKVTTHYPSGRLKDSFTVDAKGRPHGLYQTFYDTEKNGKQPLKGEANFRNGKLASVLQRFYPNGKTQINAYYQDGKLHGSYIEYDPDGKILEQSTYDEGKLIKDGRKNREKTVPVKISDKTENNAKIELKLGK